MRAATLFRDVKSGSGKDFAARHGRATTSVFQHHVSAEANPCTGQHRQEHVLGVDRRAIAESQRTVEYHIEEQSKNRNRTVEVQGRHGEPVVKLAENVSGPQEKEVGENALEQPPAVSH